MIRKRLSLSLCGENNIPFCIISAVIKSADTKAHILAAVVPTVVWVVPVGVPEEKEKGE